MSVLTQPYFKEYKIACNDTTHTIQFAEQPDGSILYNLLDHTEDEMTDQLAMVALGHELQGCVKHFVTVNELAATLTKVLEHHPELLEELHKAAEAAEDATK